MENNGLRRRQREEMVLIVVKAAVVSHGDGESSSDRWLTGSEAYGESSTFIF